MICRNCKHAVIAKTKEGLEMGRARFRTCDAAITPLEKARYFTGSHKCEWPERAVKK